MSYQIAIVPSVYLYSHAANRYPLVQIHWGKNAPSTTSPCRIATTISIYSFVLGNKVRGPTVQGTISPRTLSPLVFRYPGSKVWDLKAGDFTPLNLFLVIEVESPE